MKNVFITLILVLFVNISYAQTAMDSWAFGFGLSHPRLYSSNTTALNSNYGAYLSLHRNFSENVGLRLKGGYSHLEGQWTDAMFKLNTAESNLMTADLDLLYYPVPCAPLSPYIFAGIGANYNSLTNAQTPSSGDNNFGSQLNLGLGAAYKINESWNLVGEFGYHQTNNSELDGTVINDVSKEINGKDSYINISLGVTYLFNSGAVSLECEPCTGLSAAPKDMTDYKKIEDMIIKHIPEVIPTEVVVDKYIYAISEDRLVLVGVQFAFDKSALLPESYIVLDKAVKLLNDNPNVSVEIEGYTDYIGTAEYNQQLSVERAITVKNYLVSKGIAESRLSTTGFGRSNPVASNETDEGRAMNRRIVFRIIK